MKPVSPFFELDDLTCVDVVFDGKKLFLPDGANLAAALLAAGVAVFRSTPMSGAPRAPFCMMGACFDCLVEIDGVMRQACMVKVSDGLIVHKPDSAGGSDGAI